MGNAVVEISGDCQNGRPFLGLSRYMRTLCAGTYVLNPNMTWAVSILFLMKFRVAFIASWHESEKLGKT